MLRRFSRQRRGLDDIDAVLGSPHYATPFYDENLRLAVVGPYSRHRVAVSRYYLLLKPPVVVDFEPHREDGPFFVEEKRRYFTAKGVPYIPVFLGETLTQAEFGERVRQARKFAEQAAKLHKEDEALRGVVAPLGLPLRVPEAEIDREALAILAKDVVKNVHLRGGSRSRRLAAIKRQLVATYTGETSPHEHLRQPSPLPTSAAARPRKGRAGIGMTAHPNL